MKAHGKPFAPQFDAALDLWHSGDPEAAIAQLEALAVQYPNEAAIHGMLAGYLWEEGRLLEARPHAEAAAKLSPTSDLAARFLFHVLYDLGDKRGALHELRRFRGSTASEELREEWSNLIRQVEDELRTARD